MLATSRPRPTCTNCSTKASSPSCTPCCQLSYTTTTPLPQLLNSLPRVNPLPHQPAQIPTRRPARPLAPPAASSEPPPSSAPISDPQSPRAPPPHAHTCTNSSTEASSPSCTPGASWVTSGTAGSQAGPRWRLPPGADAPPALCTASGAGSCGFGGGRGRGPCVRGRVAKAGCLWGWGWGVGGVALAEAASTSRQAVRRCKIHDSRSPCDCCGQSIRMYSQAGRRFARWHQSCNQRMLQLQAWTTTHRRGAGPGAQARLVLKLCRRCALAGRLLGLLPPCRPTVLLLACNKRQGGRGGGQEV